MAVKRQAGATVRLDLNGDMAGQHLMARPTMKVKDLEELDSNVIARQVAVAARLFVSWDVTDAETGEPLPQPGDGGVRELTIDQLNTVLTAYVDYLTTTTAPPKA